ncbi:uncharacterized protein LOC111400869 isoform X1 [Olea europaea var. sylvestris]|uniref:uncharacterized protein LOC111400869 isoform X1 n=1 Tax=Olea europaea var. sylvestris TaxID=158386 RepID=UPI000C1CE3A1|nr:uncharacterized protein LOC111400869 isoform X1 [Olea europaea var. sylvestris]
MIWTNGTIGINLFLLRIKLIQPVLLFRRERRRNNPKSLLLSVINLMDEQSILGNNYIEDVRWLCSLSASELDFMMGLKTLIHQRAKKIGHETLVKKFDLRTLRALSFVLMTNLKGQLKNLSATSSFECNLLNHNLSDSFSSMKIEDLIPYICSDRRKRIADM